MLSLMLSFLFSAIIVAAAHEGEDISAQLARRLVDDSGQVTDAVRDILGVSGVEVKDAQLATVVEATQQTWVKKDWKFESAGVEDTATVKALLSGLLVDSAGSVSPHVICQGGALGSMAQTFAALNALVRDHEVKNVICFCPSFPLDENGIEDYKALLEVVGRSHESAKVVPANHEELVAFLKEQVYPGLKETPISVQPSAAMFDWAKEQSNAFTLVGPTKQATYHLAAIKAKCPELQVVGLRSVSPAASDVFESFYRNASSEDQQCAARLNILARELYFIQKAREAK